MTKKCKSKTGEIKEVRILEIDESYFDENGLLIPEAIFKEGGRKWRTVEVKGSQPKITGFEHTITFTAPK